MATAIVSPEVEVIVAPTDVVRQETVLARFTQTLRRWGRAIKAGAKRVGNWFVRAAKRIWNSAPVTWVVTNTKLASRWVWSRIRGPVLWAATPVAAVIFAPKAVAVMLVITLVGIAGLTYMVHRALKNVAPEQFREWLIEGAVYDSPLGKINEVDKVSETYQSREEYLESLRNAYQDDPEMISEINGRLSVLVVRSGGHKKLKKDASPEEIHNDARKAFEKSLPQFDWKWSRFYAGVRSESARDKTLRAHKALAAKS